MARLTKTLLNEALSGKVGMFSDGADPASYVLISHNSPGPASRVGSRKLGDVAGMLPKPGPSAGTQVPQ